MFKSYLKQSKALINSLTTQKDKVHPTNLRFIMGNETADMDSIFSSLIYGYYRTLMAVRKEGNVHYVPIINAREKDLPSRFETMYLLRNLKYDPTDLIFIDQYNFPELLESKNAELILVDHNIPSERFSSLMKRVTEIVDHHDDKTAMYPEGQIRSKKIQKIGSTNTLLFEEIWSNIDEFKSELEPTIFWLMLATILTDTFNLNPKEKGMRWIDKDQWAVETLCKILKEEKFFPQWLDKEGNISTKALFDTLAALKFDVNMNLNLELGELFLKDYKGFNYSKGKIGYSIFLVNFENILQHYPPEELQRQMKEFKEKEGLLVLLCLFVHPKGDNLSDLKRELVILWEDEEELGKLTKFLLEQQFVLKEQEHPLDPRCFRSLLDVNSICTRKILEPVIAKYMTGGSL